MPWLSITIETDCGHADALADALLEAGALSASIEDADAGTPAETPQFGEPGSVTTPGWERSRVVALLEADTDVDELLEVCAPLAGLDAIPPYSQETVEEQNWVQLTQSQFEPIRISGRLWIVPSWHTAPDPEAIILVLDPGMAFGTGSHPTTQLCLEWLCDHITAGCSVLDYGCGSGILAIAAAKLGAGEVLGIDIDEKAVEAARDNAERNATAIRLQHSGVPLADCFDIVLANILTNPLCVLAPAIAARVASGARVALSGVLETQAAQVIEAWAPFIALQVGATHEGWIRLEGQRPTA